MRSSHTWYGKLQFILIFLPFLSFLSCNISQVNIREMVASPIPQEPAIPRINPTLGEAHSTLIPKPQVISIENIPALKQLAQIERHPLKDFTFIKHKLFIQDSHQTTVWQWDATTHQLSYLHTFSSPNHIAVSPDGRTLATENDKDFSVEIWDVITGQLLQRLEREQYSLRGTTVDPDHISGLAFSPDGKVLAASDLQTSTAETISRIHLWLVETGQLLGFHKLEDIFHRISVEEFLTQDTIVIKDEQPGYCKGGGDSYISQWKVDELLSSDSKALQWSTEGGPCCPDWTVSSLNKEVMATSFQGGCGNKKFALVWDAETGATQTWFNNGEYDPIQALALNPEGTIVAGSIQNDIFGLWHTNAKKTAPFIRWSDTPEPFHTFSLQEEEIPDVTSLVFSADGNILVAGTDDGRIQLWDVTTHQLLHTFNGHRTTVTKVEFSIDNSLLISKSDDTVKFWGIQN